jgi:succinate dehydrogenase/fumarate reductase cytochrome b subunit
MSILELKLIVVALFVINAIHLCIQIYSTYKEMAYEVTLSKIREKKWYLFAIIVTLCAQVYLGFILYSHYSR